MRGPNSGYDPVRTCRHPRIACATLSERQRTCSRRCTTSSRPGCANSGCASSPPATGWNCPILPAARWTGRAAAGRAEGLQVAGNQLHSGSVIFWMRMDSGLQGCWADARFLESGVPEPGGQRRTTAARARFRLRSWRPGQRPAALATAMGGNLVLRTWHSCSFLLSNIFNY